MKLMPGAKSSPKCQCCSICWQNALLILKQLWIAWITFNYIVKAYPITIYKSLQWFQISLFVFFDWFVGWSVFPMFGSSTVHRRSPPFPHLQNFGERRSDPKCGSQVWEQTGEGWHHVSDVSDVTQKWWFLLRGSPWNIGSCFREVNQLNGGNPAQKLIWRVFISVELFFWYILTSIDLEKFVCQQYSLENTETHNADPLPFKVTWSFVDSSKLQWRMKAAWDQSTTMVCYLGLRTLQLAKPDFRKNLGMCTWHRKSCILDCGSKMSWGRISFWLLPDWTRQVYQALLHVLTLLATCVRRNIISKTGMLLPDFSGT